MEQRIVVVMQGNVPAAADHGQTASGKDPASTLADLYARERVPMIRLAVLLVGSRSVAEEVVQDAFLVVSQRWDAVANAGGYLRAAVVNACRMHLRRQAVERKYAHETASSVDAPLELLELHDALSRLSDRERVAIVLRVKGAKATVTFPLAGDATSVTYLCEFSPLPGTTPCSSGIVVEVPKGSYSVSVTAIDALSHPSTPVIVPFTIKAGKIKA